MMTFKRAHVATAMILTSVRWSVAHPLRDGSIDEYGSTALDVRCGNADGPHRRSWVLTSRPVVGLARLAVVESQQSERKMPTPRPPAIAFPRPLLIMCDRPAPLARPLLKPPSDIPPDGGTAYGAMHDHHGVSHAVARECAGRGACLGDPSGAGRMGVLVWRPPSWAQDGERRAFFDARIDRSPSLVAVGDAGTSHTPEHWSTGARHH